MAGITSQKVQIIELPRDHARWLGNVTRHMEWLIASVHMPEEVKKPMRRFLADVPKVRGI